MVRADGQNGAPRDAVRRMRGATPHVRHAFVQEEEDVALEALLEGLGVGERCMAVLRWAIDGHHGRESWA